MRSFLGRVGGIAAGSVLAAGVLASPAHAELGSLSGTITAADTGAPLAGCVVVYEADTEEWVDSTCSTDDGLWSVDQLPIGAEYKVKAVMNDGKHVEEWAYDARTFDDATVFTVPATVDVALDLGAVIEGTLIEENGGTASFADVLVFEVGGSPAATAHATPDWDGTWQTLVPAGSYKVRFSSDFYIQWAFQQETSADADVITVGPGDHAQVDDRFMPLAIVAGTITSDLTGEPVAGACLQFFAAHDRDMVESSTEACTDNTGSYLIPLPGAGDYFALIDHRQGDFAGEFSGDAQQAADAATLTARRGETLTFDVSLAPGATITGRAVDAKTHVPLAGICVSARHGHEGDLDRWQKVECSGEDGRWRLRGLPAGSYAVNLAPNGEEPSDYVAVWAYKAVSQASAKLFAVDAGRTTSIRDVKLVKGGTLSGRITDQFGNPVADANVNIDGGLPPWSGPQEPVLGAGTNENGEYTVHGIPPGEHVAIVHGPYFSDLAPEWSGDTALRSEADTFRVKSGSATIFNAELGPGARITGQVVTPAGQPATGHWIAQFFDAEGSIISDSEVSEGTFRSTALPVGDFTIFFKDLGPGPDFWHDGVTSREDATVVSVLAGEEKQVTVHTP